MSKKDQPPIISRRYWSIQETLACVLQRKALTRIDELLAFYSMAVFVGDLRLDGGYSFLWLYVDSK